jgi:branched-chain amino acid transport system ATP-binding protein
LSTIVAVDRVTGGYRPAPVLHEITLSVRESEVVTILGANGAGKTSLLRALVNTLPWRQGAIQVAGKPTEGTPTHELVRAGLVLVPDDRGLVPFMSVRENLELGVDAVKGSDRAPILDMSDVWELFPPLIRTQKQSAGSLSGGEQQMLAVARALLMAPRCLLLDEPSSGLAPRVAQEVFEAVERAVHHVGTSLVLVEQNTEMALRLSDRGYLLRRGELVFEGSVDELRESELIEDVYLS